MVVGAFAPCHSLPRGLTTPPGGQEVGPPAFQQLVQVYTEIEVFNTIYNFIVFRFMI